MGQFKQAVKTRIADRLGILPWHVEQLFAREAFVTPLTNPERLKRFFAGLRPIVGCRHGLIRLGPSGDGGYLVPDDLSGIAACFSPGVSAVSGFEKDCATLGMQVFMADASVDGPAEQDDKFHFVKRFLGASTHDQFITMSDWVQQSGVGDEDDCLLQMDIEGAEYEVLYSMPDMLLSRFRVIVIEFHDLQYLFSKPYFDLAAPAFQKLLQSHACVHVHANNCCGKVQVGEYAIPRVAEFTFLRRDRVDAPSWAAPLPHPLDVDNTNNQTLELDAFWAMFH